ncbi:methyl-accepting chemotaxis protein [Paenibacillus abyssi]
MNQLEEQMEEKEGIVSNITQDKVDSTIEASILLAEQLSYHPQVIQAFKENKPELIHEALEKSVQTANEKANIDLIWFTRIEDRTSDGFTPIFACPSNPAFDGFDQLNYTSTNQAMDSGETVASWEVNAEDGKLQVTTPIFDEEKVVGAIVVGQQTYQGFVKNIAEASNTSATLFLTPDQQQIYVMTDSLTDEIGNRFFEDSHEKLGPEAAKLSELADNNALYADMLPFIQQSVTSAEAFTETIMIEGEPYVMQFNPFITYDGKTVGTYVTRFPDVALAKQEIADQAREREILLYSIALGLIVLCIILTYLIAKRIAKPITQMTSRLEMVAGGDLRGSDIVTGSQDEVGRLGLAINAMVGKWRDIITRTNETAAQVTASSAQLATGAEETKQATTQISSDMQEVASGAERQVQGSEESTKAMGEIAAGIGRIAESSSVVSQSSIDATAMAEQGQQSVNEVVSQMQLIHRSVGESAGMIAQLGERSREIDQIVSVITDLSEQTNLLALNAAIEAARAGEHGRGFAVVAGEVKKLAEQSRSSAGQITALIQEIQRDTNIAVESMNNRTTEVEQGLALAEHSGETFIKILASIEKVAEQIQEVSAAAQQVSASSEQVAASVEEQSVIAKSASFSSQNAASASEQQLASMEEIAVSAKRLSVLANDLQAMINTFKL